MTFSHQIAFLAAAMAEEGDDDIADDVAQALSDPRRLAGLLRLQSIYFEGLADAVGLDIQDEIALGNSDTGDTLIRTTAGTIALTFRALADAARDRLEDDGACADVSEDAVDGLFSALAAAKPEGTA